MFLYPKLLLLHGDNLAASRNYLNGAIKEAKKQNYEIISLDGLKIDLTDLKQALETTSLFGQPKLVIIERFFSKPASTQKDQLLSYLNKEVEVFPHLVFWESKPVTSSWVKKLGNKYTVKEFRTPLIVFKFLDSVFPGNEKTSLSLLRAAIQETSEFIFYMLTRRVSQLIIIKHLGKKGLKDAASWQQNRLLSQASKFSPQQLLAFYQRLLKVDVAIKTGQNPMALDWHLDLLIAGL